MKRPSTENPLIASGVGPVSSQKLAAAISAKMITAASRAVGNPAGSSRTVTSTQPTSKANETSPMWKSTWVISFRKMRNG